MVRSLCEGKILPQLDKLTKHTLNEHENAGFCRGGDWNVKTNPKGGCGKQKARIRKRYNDKIASLEAFLVDTQQAAERERLRAERELRQRQLAEQKRLAAEEELRPELSEAGIIVAEEVAADIKHIYFGDSPEADEQFEKAFNENTILEIKGHHRGNELQQRLNYKSHLILSAKVTNETIGLAAAVEEVVNEMNLEQLKATHDLCLYPGAWINDRAQRVKGQCGAFKDGL